MVISLVLDLPKAAVGFNELVPPLHEVPMTMLVLGLHVTRVVVVNGIRELVLREGLGRLNAINRTNPCIVETWKGI